MPLDIDKLRLTKSEYYDVIRKVYIYATPSYPKEVIDAQLAKALWVLADQFDEDSYVTEEVTTGEDVLVGDVIRAALEKTGIPRPEVMKEA